MELVVGTDSTWSLRAWICAKLAGVQVSERIINLSAKGYKAELLKYSPSGLVPALNTGSIVICDSLAIAEYLNEWSSGTLFPRSVEERALARSICAEIHSGFVQIRTQHSFTLDTVMKPLQLDDAVKKELQRLAEIFSQARLPFMHADAGCVDAFLAIMAYRLHIYGIYLPGKAGDYQKNLLDWQLLGEAIERAQFWRKHAEPGE